MTADGAAGCRGKGPAYSGGGQDVAATASGREYAGHRQLALEKHLVTDREIGPGAWRAHSGRRGARG